MYMEVKMQIRNLQHEDDDDMLGPIDARTGESVEGIWRKIE